jgi:hypothetical protein
LNIITVIQTALIALNSDAELFLLEQSRAENEELNHTGDVIIVYPDWESRTEFNQSLEAITTTVYNIVFKTLDEWDNSDDDLTKSYDNSTSVDRIEAMEKLARSVFWYISANNDLFPEIKEKLKWTSPKPILRENNGTMTGVKTKLTVNYIGERVCDYSII